MKKIASLLLTVVLLATMLSVFAVPASAEAQTIPGTDITWELTENDTKLTIGGTGKMPEFNVNAALDNRPWKDHIETITTVVIESGVTNIGNFVFYDCTNLTSVTIPYGVTMIGQSAFQDCVRLQSVTIPSSVTSIEYSAFYGCRSLQSVTIPYGVANIGSDAFQNCINLQSVTIPSSVTNIGTNAFTSCGKLASVTVKTSTPPTLGQMVFINTPARIAIYVPCGAGTAYQEATNWSGKSGQIKEAYIVDDQPGENGTIMLDKDCFPTETYKEETVTVTVMPAGGYRLKADSLLVTYKDKNGAEKTADLTQDETDPMKYTFTMPCSNVTVKAEFEEITDESEPTLTATVFSEGNIWIIIAVAVVVIAGIATLVIVKKKKKPVLASGESKNEE